MAACNCGDGASAGLLLPGRFTTSGSVTGEVGAVCDVRGDVSSACEDRACSPTIRERAASIRGVAGLWLPAVTPLSDSPSRSCCVRLFTSKPREVVGCWALTGTSLPESLCLRDGGKQGSASVVAIEGSNGFDSMGAWCFSPWESRCGGGKPFSAISACQSQRLVCIVRAQRPSPACSC